MVYRFVKRNIYSWNRNDKATGGKTENRPRTTDPTAPRNRSDEVSVPNERPKRWTTTTGIEIDPGQRGGITDARRIHKNSNTKSWVLRYFDIGENCAWYKSIKSSIKSTIQNTRWSISNPIMCKNADYEKNLFVNPRLTNRVFDGSAKDRNIFRNTRF